VCAFLLRVYKIDSPVLDWHSFRQADTASVTREYVKHGIDILHPKYHDLANIQSGLNNTEGYRMVEFPIINAVIASLVKLFPLFSIEITHRVLSILFSLGTLLYLFLFVKNISGTKVAYTTAIVFALLPFNIYYSRTILPEPGVVFFFTVSLYYFYQWLKLKKISFLVISTLCLVLAGLLKPFVVFFFPLYIALAYSVGNKHIFKNPMLYAYFVVSVLPFIWWRDWISQFPSGIPANSWLFDGFVTPFPDDQPRNRFTELLHKLFGYNKEGLRYHPAWFRWLGYERLTKLFLGYSGVLFLVASLYKLKKTELIVFVSWWLSVALYFLIIARGNVQHDYYQVIIMPLIAWSVGRGMVTLESLLSKKLSHLISFLIIIVLFILSLFLSWKMVKGYYSINNPEYVIAGEAVDRLTPPDAKVIAPAFGDTMFLYQTNRTGWPIGYDIDKKIELGATHYISTSYDEEAKMLEEKYFTIEKSPQYILIDLTKDKNSKP
jgi:4-amino-4-deoxy-L-arabinose transferase-like glycosyltransferase